MVRLVGIQVIPHDVTATIDPEGVGKGSARELNRRERGAVRKYVRCSAKRRAKRE